MIVESAGAISLLKISSFFSVVVVVVVVVRISDGYFDQIVVVSKQKVSSQVKSSQVVEYCSQVESSRVARRLCLCL